MVCETYANTIHRTPVIRVVAVVMQSRPEPACARDVTGMVVRRYVAGAAKEGMPLENMNTRGAVKCCVATSCTCNRNGGDPGAIRTHDLPLRRGPLYPAELRGLGGNCSGCWIWVVGFGLLVPGCWQQPTAPARKQQASTANPQPRHSPVLPSPSRSAQPADRHRGWLHRGKSGDASGAWCRPVPVAAA